MNYSGIRNINRFLPTILFLTVVSCAALLFLFELACGISPVLSAQTLSEHLWIAPFPAMTEPLWSGLMILANYLPLSAPVLFNGLSAIFAVICIMLFYHILSRWLFLGIPSKYAHPRAMETAALLLPVIGCATLMTTIPFRLMAARANPMMFDLMLLLLAILTLLRFTEYPCERRLYLTVFIWSIGVPEYTAFIPLAPVALFIIFIYMWQGGLLQARPIFISGLIGMLALGVYPVYAGFYFHHPAYDWRSFQSFGQIIWQMWREQYQQLDSSIASIGWLLIFFICTLPLLTLLILPLSDKGKNRYHIGHAALFSVLWIVSAFFFLQLPPTPWPMLGIRPLVIIPYLCFAAWFGRISCLTYLVIMAPKGRHHRSGRIKQLITIVYLIALTSALTAAGLRTGREVSSVYEDAIDSLAKTAVTACDQHAFLVMSGGLENNIRIACRDQQADLKVINLSYGLSRTYRNYVSSLFSSERLKNLATINFGAALEEWMHTDTHITEHLAIMADPNIWSRSGFKAIPSLCIYEGVNKNEMMNTATLKKDTEFWKTHLANWTIPTSEATAHFAAPWYRLYQRYVGKIVNNLGVSMQNNDMDDTDAWDAYQMAREIDNTNLSALMNLVTLAQQTNNPKYDAYRHAFDALMNENANRIPLWQLSMLYGYVQHPAAYIEQGFAWAISGKPYAAINEIRQAIDLSSESIPMKILLAALYLDANDDQAGESIYQDILDKDPSNVDALVGMARLALTRNNMPMARDYLEKLSETDVDPSSTPIEGLVVAMATLNGNYDNAKKLLQNKLKDNPMNYRIWAILALLASENEDLETLKKTDKALTEGVEINPILGTVLGQMEMNRGNYPKARHYLEQALRVRPSESMLRENLLRVLTAVKDKDEAEKQCAMILINDPDNALANYIIGTIQMERNEWNLAENSFQSSLAAKRDANTLNDLAWLLTNKGLFQDALPLIKESIDMQPQNATALDTYGYLLMQTSQLREAKETLDKARHYQPENPVILFHLAQLHQKMGHTRQAIDIVNSLQIQKRDILLPALQKELQSLKNELNKK